MAYPEDTGFAIVGKRPCGCIRAAAVEYANPDKAESRRLGKFVAEIVGRGLTVDRVTIETVRTGFTSCAKCKQPEPKQAELFCTT